MALWCLEGGTLLSLGEISETHSPSALLRQQRKPQVVSRVRVTRPNGDRDNQSGVSINGQLQRNLSGLAAHKRPESITLAPYLRSLARHVLT
jgi:hypothetical protein